MKGNDSMNFDARVILDSMAPSGFRLTTFVLTYPRIIHSEFMTHRMFSRNSASSRAIPVTRMLREVEKHPFIPLWWGKAEPGMQAREEISERDRKLCEQEWLIARDEAAFRATRLLGMGLHKQIPNRLLEPFSWITVVMTTNPSGLENFAALRNHEDAEPHFHKIASMVIGAYMNSKPEKRNLNSWHMPFIYAEDVDDLMMTRFGDFGLAMDESVTLAEKLHRISVARCARVSYLNHEGTRDVKSDLTLFERLRTSGHWSAFEHVAKALDTVTQSGNFTGWLQYRKTFEHECRSYDFATKSQEK